MLAPNIPSIAIAALMLTACATGIDSAVFMVAPPIDRPEDVRIYQTQLPTCPYDEIGIVTWEPTSGWQKLQAGVDRMRQRAARMGGHAIIGFSIAERSSGSTTTINSDSTAVTVGSTVNTTTRVAGTVVRFRDPNACR
jgi:hypothetical protein